jgi:hypothetical protein
MAEERKAGKQRARKQKAQPGQVTIATLPHVRGEDHKTIYANFAQGAITPWDLSIIFGRIGETEEGKPAIIDVATVVITIPLAKAFMGVLQGNIRSWEEQFGEAQMPKGLVAAQRQGKSPQAKEPKPQEKE